MNKFYLRLCVFAAVFLTGGAAFAQTFTDGPIQLQVRLRDVSIGFNETDVSLLGVGFAPDEPVVYVWARDNADLDGQGWMGGTCHTFKMGTGGVDGPLPAVTPPINEMLLSYTYPTATVPQFFDIRVNAWEDDNPSDGIGPFCSGGQVCSYDAATCCGVTVLGTCVGLNEGDDKQCNADPFKTQMPYRNGPPCQWYFQGYVQGPCGTDWKPGIETYWRYTNGTSCANALDLGTLISGDTLTHYNSNICYGNTHTASPGNDVWYKFHVNAGMGITASLCGIDGAQFNSVLYMYGACNQSIPLTSNDDACGTQSSLSFSICQPGDYFLVVDAATAADTGTFTLRVAENPTFSFTATMVKKDVSCAGGSDGKINVAIQGGQAPYTFSWNPSSVGTTDSATGLAAGTYSVTVTDNQGCQATASIQITQPIAISATATGVPVSCGGACNGSATATVQNGTTPYSYSWNSLPPQQLQTATFLCAGNYTVTVTDANGCSVTADANVATTATILITLDSLKNVQCNGQGNGGVFITTTNGVTPYQFHWSNSVTTEDNPNLGPGAYALTVTDNTGCTAGDSWNITEPSALTSSVSFTFDPRCNAGSDGIVDITVNGGVQPYTYHWSPGNATSQNLNNVTAGTYNATVTDANNCTATVTGTLNEPTPFNIQLTSTALNCPGDQSGTASVTVSGETSPYTYFWSNFATTQNNTGLDAGPFSVQVTDAHNCDTIVTGTITSPAALDISITSSAPLCADSGNGTINTVVTGGTAPFSYHWSGPGSFDSTAQNPQVGSGSYTVTATDSHNCTITGGVTVSTAEPFVVTLIGINPNCQKDSSGAAVANSTGGKLPFHYTWNIAASDTASYIQHLPSGSYSVTVLDNNGCQQTGSVVLEDPATNPESCGNDKYVVLIPSAWTPNGDNLNDKLVALSTNWANIQKLNFYMLDRWGEVVYSNPDMKQNDGWDGRFKGKEQPAGTYVYFFKVIYTNGVHAEESGSATLIR